MKIIISGSLAYDRIMNFPGRFEDHIIPEKIHKLNVSFMVKEFKETCGGAAGNIAYNLSLLNEKPLIYAAVGRDFDKYREKLASFKIITDNVKVYSQTLTASAYIITDRNDNQITGFFPGAMNFYGRKPNIKRSDFAIISPGNPNEMLDLAELYGNQNVPYIFDPGQQIIQFTKNQLKKVIRQSAAYIVNDYELTLTEKITGFDKDAILHLANVLIVTLGKKGSIIELYKNDYYKRFVIAPVKAEAEKDPTGAGDAYRAGLIKGLAINNLRLLKADPFKLSWLKIGQMASLAAVYAVEQYGTQNHFYKFDQFKKRYFLTFKEKI